MKNYKVIGLDITSSEEDYEELSNILSDIKAAYENATPVHKKRGIDYLKTILNACNGHLNLFYERIKLNSVIDLLKTPPHYIQVWNDGDNGLNLNGFGRPGWMDPRDYDREQCSRAFNYGLKPEYCRCKQPDCYIYGKSQLNNPSIWSKDSEL